MLLGRVFRWLCDFCGDKQETVGYGLPDGWKWIPAVKDVALRHICRECYMKNAHGKLPTGDSGQLKAK